MSGCARLRPGIDTPATRRQLLRLSVSWLKAQRGGAYLMSGSRENASSTAITDSLFSRSTLMAGDHAQWKVMKVWNKSHCVDKSAENRSVKLFRRLETPTIRKVPSILLTSIAFCSILVRRNGTFSGYLSRTIATSKQSPKSTWMTMPLSRLRIKLDGCRSPRPRIWPTLNQVNLPLESQDETAYIDMTANDRV